MVWFARSVHDTLSRVAIGLVIGGALGNLCDRLFRVGLPRSGFLGGRVVDFVYLSWWPTFNVADSCVVVGGILLAIATLRLPEPTPDPARPDPADARFEARVSTDRVPAALDGERVDRVVAMISGCSRSEASDAVDGGHVRLDGRIVVKGATKVAEGQVIDIAVDPVRGRRNHPDPTPRSCSTWSTRTTT